MEHGSKRPIIQIGMLSKELELEAQAFDEQIRERLQNGYTPDLRLMQPCNWFRNNIWRRPYLVNILYGRVLRFCLAHLHPLNGRVLEVGCGPGFMSLELARHGFKVVGLDISTAALEIAAEMAQKNPFTENWGELQYIRTDFLSWTPTEKEKFDSVLFFGSFHHFPDPTLILEKTISLLAPGGRVIAYEPARDWWTETEAMLMALVRVLLSATGHWFNDLPVPTQLDDFSSLVADCLTEVQEAKPKNEVSQSPLDNSSYGTEILSTLRERFEEIAYEPDMLLFDRLAAGMRFESEEQAQQLATFLQVFELYALKDKLIKPGGFMFAGQLINEE